MIGLAALEAVPAIGVSISSRFAAGRLEGLAESLLGRKELLPSIASIGLSPYLLDATGSGTIAFGGLLMTLSNRALS